MRERRREVRERRKHENQRNVLKDETIRILIPSRDQRGEMEQIQPHHEYNNFSLTQEYGVCLSYHRAAMSDEAAQSYVLPGIDEVLGNADTGWRACDCDLPHSRTISGAGNFDMSPRDLANLIDLATLSANYAANKLEGREGNMQMANKLIFPCFSELNFRTKC